ncbi:hypothetical protein [Pseudoalteromonas xiamenensis]
MAPIKDQDPSKIRQTAQSFNKEKLDMSILTTQIGLEHIALVNGHANITCQCCKHSETASTKVISPTDWLVAASYLGWRHVRTEYTDIDVVCPDCVKAFHSHLIPQIKEAV